MGAVFANPLVGLSEYQEFSSAFLTGKDPVGMTGCIDSEKVHLMSTFLREDKMQLVVTYSEQRAREIEEDYKLFTSQVYVLPPKDLIFFNADLRSNEITAQRMRAFQAIYQGDAKVVITTMDAMMSALTPFEQLMDHVIVLKSEMVLDLEDLKHRLVVLGYDRVGRVEQPGQFTIHGGIADIFPLTADMPIRIELWGDEIDTIRYFDPASQRSLDRVDTISIFPATEIIADAYGRQKAAAAVKKTLEKVEATFREARQPEYAKQIRQETERILEQLTADMILQSADSYIRFFYHRTVRLESYFDKKRTLIFLDEPVRLLERGNGVQAEFDESMKIRLEQGWILPEQADLLIEAKQVLASLEHGQVAALCALDSRLPEYATGASYALNVQNMNTYREGFDLLIRDLQRWKKEKYRIVLLCPSHTKGQRMVSQLQEEGLLAYYSEEPEKEIAPGEIMVTYGNLHRGFLYPMLRFAVLTENDIFGIKKKKREKKKQYDGKRIQSFAELKPGDYVVHENYGLGVYRGTERRLVDHVTKDYIKLEYGDGGQLLFPVTQLHLIQKYADAAAKQPKLNNLSGPEWSKTKNKVQKAVANIAKDLVELYAARQKDAGYEYSPDTLWQKEFEELVPFEETNDQLAAIEATKADMESKKIMDRLICGDVGYGKTEIAIRAAFKAVMDSKQVAFLVPTTILAQQHYNTFVERMKDYPVKIELLSRFRSSAQIKKTVERLREGQVDIVVGTHRLLSKDVVFKDLGLLMIDEEQRFGVTHKEKIKQIKKNVDVLTLTATPIPRTLHMSLIGVRDMSVLEEAPYERRPIQTYVMEMNWEMVREAMNRELARDGQIYYVYNRVKDIDQVAAEIAKLVPDANVAYAHGQMEERQLEQIMMDFVNGDIDVLVSTTIIETGLDIPNVNTIIIHDADRYGLSQLYQLRGRVGRSNRTSYAFIMYQRNKLLKEVAEKRLQAIREYTELGSGIKIAMRDLEIRGAGNLLGSEQHGHMEAVGYDLYCKMLNLAVKREKGELELMETFDTLIDLPVNAYIPDTYIRSEYDRMEIYKRIAAISTEEESMDMVDELIDRFGTVPKQVMRLIEVSQVRMEAHGLYVTEIRANQTELRVFMHPRANLSAADIPDLIRSYGGALRLLTGETPYFLLSAGKGIIREKVLDMNLLKKLLNDIKALIVS